MKHLEEQELVLYHYGEGPGRDEVERHLAGCGRCRTEYETLRAVLSAVDDLPVPERTETYPRELWQRVVAGLPRRGNRLGWRRLSFAAAAAMLLLAAFIAGQWHGSNIAMAEPVSEEARERVLLAAVGDHLERSERALLELMNTSGNGDFDLAGQRERAAELAADNRLYRRTAGTSGESGIAKLLEELERVLIEIANSPEKISAEEWTELRRRIAGRGLLLKIDIIEDDARKRGGFGKAPPGADHV